MISLTSIPDTIKDGDTGTIKLDIQGRINIQMYKGSYFNLIIKKNGGTLAPVTLYPLRFNGFPLEWEVNSNSYGSYGTFNVNCIVQDGPLLTTTTFIVEPDCIIKKINTCNNITSIEQANRLKTLHVKKQEIPIDYTGGCAIQKPNMSLIQQIIKEPKINQDFKSNLISSVKVQKASNNVNSGQK